MEKLNDFEGILSKKYSYEKHEGIKIKLIKK